jgi:Flp pilus assembly pilin Flp
MHLIEQILKSLREERGQTMVEYALILAMIALALVAALSLFAPALNGFYSTAVGMFP